MEDELKRLMNLQEDAKRLMAHPKPLNEASEAAKKYAQENHGFFEFSRAAEKAFDAGYRRAIEKLRILSEKDGTVSDRERGYQAECMADWLEKEMK